MKTLICITSKECPACRRMVPVMNKLQEEGVKIKYLDIKEASKYLPSVLPTLIVWESGELKRFTGVTRIEDIREALTMHKDLDYKIW